MSPSASNVQFDIGQMITTSWEIFKNNLGPLLGGAVVVLALISAGSMVYIGGIILSGPLVAGFYKVCLAGVRGEPLDFGDVFWGFKKFLPTFLAYLVTTIFAGIGMIFCIIPGILVAILYFPTYLFIIDQGLDFWDAMEASRKMVMNNFGQWLLLGVVTILLSIAGMLACCVGSFVAMPIVFLMITMAYEQERKAVPVSMAPPAPPAY
jgi:uncharacterized membrane protein